MLIIGIDWADQQHLVCVIEPGGRTTSDTFDQDPDEIADWIHRWQQRFPGHTLAIALEQSRGPLIHALLGFDGLRLYPLNPKQLQQKNSPSSNTSNPLDESSDVYESPPDESSRFKKAGPL